MPTSVFQPKLLTQSIAQIIVNKLGSTGTPPEFGLSHFTVGITPYIRVLKEEYLENFIKLGGSSFKLVIGNYGGGKTHFLYSLREIAWQENYIVSYVPLSPGECPFSKLELVYKAIMANLTPPVEVTQRGITHYQQGPEALLRKWVVEESKNSTPTWDFIESSSFSNATRAAIKALQEDKEEVFQRVLQWLKGEEVSREIRNEYGITERVDKTTAFRLLRSLSQWVSELNYAGLVLLFDEAERSLSIASAREQRIAFDNLRQLIDECGNGRFPSVLILYAIPDERQLFDDRLEAYEALRQRLSGVISKVNPSGVRIQLEELEISPLEFLGELGRKLAILYQTSYQKPVLDEGLIKKTIETFAQEAYEERYADIGYRRVFVKSIIQAFHLLRQTQRPIPPEKAQQIIRNEIVYLEAQPRRASNEQEF
jgi:hypothetical protein